MKTITVDDAALREVIGAQHGEPLEILKGEARIGVFLPDADAELIEDMLIALRVDAARQEGTVGIVASADLLARLKHAGD